MINLHGYSISQLLVGILAITVPIVSLSWIGIESYGDYRAKKALVEVLSEHGYEVHRIKKTIAYEISHVLLNDGFMELSRQGRLRMTVLFWKTFVLPKIRKLSSKERQEIRKSVFSAIDI